MADARPLDKRKRIVLKPGHYMIRHLCQESDNPVTSIGYAPSVGKVWVIGKTRSGQVVLETMDDLALVYVEDAEASLNVTVFLPNGYNGNDVKIKVDKIGPDVFAAVDPSPSLLNEVAAPIEIEAGLAPYLSGHIGSIGDMIAKPGEWLGSQSGSELLEGFAIHWPGRPSGVELAYGCSVVGLGDSPRSYTGEFVGARRRSAPISSLWAEITGIDAQKYDFTMSACFFRRGYVEGRSGETITGLGQEDYVVGLNVFINRHLNIN